MSDNTSYWQTREILARERLFNLEEKELNKLVYKACKSVYNRILLEMKVLYAELAANKQLSISHLYTYNKYYDLLNHLEEELTKLSNQKIYFFEEKLEDMYKKNAKIIGKQFPLSDQVDETRMREAIIQAWAPDNKTFSDRIWEDKDKLKEILIENLTDCIVTGATTKKLTETLMHTFGVKYHEAERLARTELVHIQNQSTLNSYLQAGITKVRILPCDDERTCEICHKFEGQIYDIRKVPLLPAHPHCRCAFIAVIGE